MTVKELTVCGTQLIVDFAEYSLGDVNTKNKLREVLSDYISKWNSGDRESGLLFPPDSVIDNDGNSVELLIKKKWGPYFKANKRKDPILVLLFL